MHIHFSNDSPVRSINGTKYIILNVQWFIMFSETISNLSTGQRQRRKTHFTFNMLHNYSGVESIAQLPFRTIDKECMGRQC